MDLDTTRGIAALRAVGLDPSDFDTSHEFVEAFSDVQARRPRAGDHYRLAAEAVAQRRAQNRRIEELQSDSRVQQRGEISGLQALEIAFAQSHDGPKVEPNPEAGKKPGIQLLEDYFQTHQ